VEFAAAERFLVRKPVCLSTTHHPDPEGQLVREIEIGFK
jgi:hypothetical protein